jgi:hypothetical protein
VGPLRQFNTTTNDLGIDAFLDLQATDHYSFQAFGASAAIGKQEVGAGSIYFLALRDNTTAVLDGSKTYRLTVPGPVPGELFWSATVYDIDTRSQIVTDHDRAAVRSLFEKPEANPDGSIDLYFGPTPPGG